MECNITLQIPTMVLISLLTLSGCDTNTSQAMLADYSQRVSNVLETEISTDTTQNTLPNFPQKRDRIIPTPDIRQSLWEVLDFRKCDMLSIISERNSSLGKVMAASQKMRYELRFINALRQCKEKLAAIIEPDESQQAFKVRLETIYQTKKANLRDEIWNGSGGGVIRAFKKRW